MILWLQYCKDLFLLPKTNETNLISNHSFLFICQIEILWVFLFSSIYCFVTFNNFWKSILKRNPSLPPLPFSFIHLGERNVNGELQCLWVSVKVAHCKLFFPLNQVTVSADLTWLSARDTRVLQIYLSGGFRPVFLFVLGFLACCIFGFVFFFFVVPFIFYTKQISCFGFFFIIIISLWVSC